MAKQIKKYSKIALIVGLSIALMSIHLMTPPAKAGTFADKELRISDSRLGATSVYYDFLATDVGGAVSCVQIKFCDETDIDGSCTAPDNMETFNASLSATTTVFDWNNLEASNWEIYASTSNSLVASTSIDTASEDWGTAGSLVIGGMQNSDATQTYFAWIQTFDDQCSSLSSEVDRGVVAFAILSGVTVTATVAESLSVTVTASTCDNFMTGSYATSSSATTSIAFGTVTTEQFYDSCQRLDIGTNANSGYIARIHKTQRLTEPGNQVSIDDGVCDSACGTSTEAVWEISSNNGFGYCMWDESSNAAATADAGWGTNYCGQSASNQYFKIISNTASSSEAIMQADSATSSNNAWIGYRLSVDAAQAAGNYTTEVIYTITPKY